MSNSIKEERLKGIENDYFKKKETLFKKIDSLNLSNKELTKEGIIREVEKLLNIEKEIKIKKCIK